MAKLQRVKQEIFAQQAGSRQITAFGTAKTETPEYTTDLTQIQNTNFLQGWFSAVLSDKAPYEEDTNALFYTITKQLAYLFQEGIPEYDPNTEYNIGSLVKNIDNQGNVTIYKSLVDNNIGNALNTSDYWRIYQSDGATGIAMYEIGLPQPTFSNTLLSNEIWLEGQEVSRTEYGELFSIYGTTYGAGNGTSTFNLPDCRNRVLWGASSFGYVEAGAPNITGIIWGLSVNEDTILTGSGACEIFPIADRNGFQGDGEANRYQLNFNASKSSGVYGKSNTIQPPGIKVRVKTRYK